MILGVRSTILQSLYSDYHKDQKRWGVISGGTGRGVLFKSWIGVGKKVLDLGCRDGALTKFYLDNNKVIGADIDDHALKLCIARIGIPVVCLDMNRTFPFRSGEFDVVVMGEVLEHGFFPQLILKEVHRVLKDGGLVVGSVPNAYRLKNRLRFLLGHEFQRDRMHLHFFSIKRLRYLLSQYFDNIFVIPITSRFLAFSPTLFANTLAWRCVKTNPHPRHEISDVRQV